MTAPSRNPARGPAVPAPFMAGRVDLLPTASLIPYARNARKHPDWQIAQIAASIREFGFLVPVLADGANGIIAGHGRVLAAQKLGLESIPCIQAAHLSETQKRAFILADNKLTENAGWDDGLLRLEMTDLQAADFDLKLTGFDEGELSRLLTPPDAGDDPPAPEVRAQTIIRPGDLWLLGKHRLVCGDSTKAEDARRLLEVDVPFMMVTDPPYGVEYEPAWRQEAAEKGLIGFPDPARLGKVANDNRIDWSPAFALFPGDVAYTWTSSCFAETTASLRAAKFEIRSQIIWRKHHFAISRGHYHWQHETCWYAVRKGRPARWAGDRSQGTVWDIQTPMGTVGSGNEAVTPHATQKPLECMARPIRNHGAPGDFVYDPFLGSGTTLIACERLGRACLGMEIDPRYIDVAIRRWQAETGGMATRAADGAPFGQMAHAPAPAASNGKGKPHRHPRGGGSPEGAMGGGGEK